MSVFEHNKITLLTMFITFILNTIISIMILVSINNKQPKSSCPGEEGKQALVSFAWTRFAIVFVLFCIFLFFSIRGGKFKTHSLITSVLIGISGFICATSLFVAIAMKNVKKNPVQENELCIGDKVLKSVYILDNISNVALVILFGFIVYNADVIHSSVFSMSPKIQISVSPPIIR